jgi:hypothetical protein
VCGDWRLDDGVRVSAAWMRLVDRASKQANYEYLLNVVMVYLDDLMMHRFVT